MANRTNPGRRGGSGTGVENAGTAGTTGTTGGAGAAVDANNRMRREGELDIDASTTEGVDTGMAGTKPGRLDQRGMISQGDMDASGDNDELRRQRRENINPSQPVVPEKPV